jgi:prepilin-type N-terminal cleavage/methylation domain-containing protein
VREREAGFTLIELAVVVAIVAIMAAASIWLFGLHPGALRASVDGFDQRYAEARSLAATSGNGATIVFAPRTTGPGFVMSVYSGRPTAASAVTRTNTMQLVSDADISEATLGSPPFAIFLSSAGNASASAQYPSFDNHGNATFAVIAKQPTCPSAGGFTLMFRSANGATDVRKLSCGGVMALGTAAPQPTMTPEQLRIDTPFMLAHWTTDAGPLHFKVGEFGYTHWFASADANPSCARFNPGYPYANASAAEMALAPAPPANMPYTWAAPEIGHPPDQPPGAFAMSPVAGNGGFCMARIVDDHGQEVDSAIQVMGDLTPQNLSVPYTITMKTTDPAPTVIVGKTFDTEQLQLQFGGKCRGIVSVAQTGHAEASSVSTQATTASFAITPVAAGDCVLEVTDQYGEPHVFININVANPQPMATWPMGVMYGLNGTSLALAGGAHEPVSVASTINALLGGGIASAAGCPAIAYKDAAMTQIDANNSTFASIGVLTDSRGCYGGAVVAYEPSGSASSYTVPSNGCPNSVQPLFWSAQPAVSSRLSVATGSSPVIGCNITLQDGSNTGQGTAGSGLVVASVVNNDCMSTPCVVGTDIESNSPCDMDPTTGGTLGSWDTTTAAFTVGAGLGTLASDGSNWLFTRTAYGPVTVELTYTHENDTLGGSPIAKDEHCVKQTPSVTRASVSF